MTIKVQKTVTINKPADELYRYWHNFEHLPRFMKHLKFVKVYNEQRSHWIANAPLGGSVEWDADIVEDRENELISWSSVAGANVHNSGLVRFTRAPGDRGTEVKVVMQYVAKKHAKAEVINYEETHVGDALKEMTGGRGPDACIDAVGLEAHGVGLEDFYDQTKQKLKLETDRPHVLREMMVACGKGGTLSIMGVYGGYVDKIPFGAAMNKALTFRMGQMYGQKYMHLLLQLILDGKLDPSFVITHQLPLEQAPYGYQIFQQKQDNCIKVVLRP